jgi:cation:H+ antiporter
LLGYIATMRFSQPGEYLPRWQPTHTPEDGLNVSDAGEAVLKGMSNGRLYTLTATSGLVILAAGWALARTGDALGEQTGLGASFVGVALVAASTSLPELSTTLGAVRRGRPQMAVSNILGTNCLELALFFLADLVYRGGPILAGVDRSALFAGAAGMMMTCLFLLGLLERRNRTLLRMGLDSIAVLVVYIVAIVGLYWLR